MKRNGKKTNIFKTLASLCIALVVALSFAACGNKNTGANVNPETPAITWTIGSAYTQAQAEGYTGTFDEFLRALAGITSVRVDQTTGHLMVRLGDDETEVDAGKVTGENGAAGRGIVDVQASSSGVTTYITITFTEGEPFQFSVTNGLPGDPGNTPQLRINPNTNVWEYSTNNGLSWTSLGVQATGNDGVTPHISDDGYWMIGDYNTGVKAYTTYTVTFDYNGMEDFFVTTPASVEVRETEWLGTKLPAAISAPGFKGFFAGWYAKDEQTKFGKYSYVGGDVTLEPMFNFNAIIDVYEMTEGPFDTFDDLIVAFNDAGIDLLAYEAGLDSDYKRLIWDREHDTLYIYLVDENRIDYLDSINKPNSQLDCFAIYTADDYEIEDGENPGEKILDLTGQNSSSSVYLAPNAELAGVDIIVDKGIDVGSNAGIKSVTYRNPAVSAVLAQHVILRTNGGTLTIDAPYDTVDYYGNADTVNIISCANHSCTLHGVAAFVTIAQGRVVLTSEAAVGGVHVVATETADSTFENPKYEFKEIVLAAVDTTNIPSITRDEVTLENNSSCQVFKLETTTTSGANAGTQAVYVHIEKDGSGNESAAVYVDTQSGQQLIDISDPDSPEEYMAYAIASAVEDGVDVEDAKEIANSNIIYVSTETELNAAVTNKVPLIYLTDNFTQTNPVALNYVVGVNENNTFTINGNGTRLKATVSGNATIVLNNIHTTYINVTADNGFTGTLIFNGGLLETDSPGTADADAAFYSTRNPNASFEFRNMTIAANITKGIKIYQAANVIIDNCNFDATKLEVMQDAVNSDKQSLSLVDIQIGTGCTGTNITIINSHFEGAPQGSTAVPTFVDASGEWADSDTGAAIKIKAENGVEFGTVTIAFNTFVNNYRDILLGTGPYANQLQAPAATASNGRSAEGLKNNTIEDWNIYGNETTFTDETVAERGVATLSYIGGPTTPLNFNKFTTRVGNVGRVEDGCAIWVIADAFEKVGDTWYYKETDGTLYSVATGANYSVTLTEVSATVSTEAELTTALADNTIVYIYIANDIELENKIDFNRDVVLDLNDNTLTFASDCPYLINNLANKTVTIKNGTIEYTSSIVVNAITSFINNYGNLTLDNVSVELENLRGNGVNNINAFGNWGEGVLVITDSQIVMNAYTAETNYKTVGVFTLGRTFEFVNSTLTVYCESTGSAYGIYNYIDDGESNTGTRTANIVNSTIDVTSTAINSVSGIFSESYLEGENTTIINIGENTVVNVTRINEATDGNKKTYGLRAKGNATINGANNATITITDETGCTILYRGAETTGVIND